MISRDFQYAESKNFQAAFGTISEKPGYPKVWEQKLLF